MIKAILRARVDYMIVRLPKIQTYSVARKLRCEASSCLQLSAVMSDVDQSIAAAIEH